MAGRCGCSGPCSCVLDVEAPLTKRGNGSVTNRWVLGINPDELFTDIAGPGLIYDEGTDKFQVCLSRDTGNSLRFGADGCLYAPGGDTPVPEVCARTVDGLPEAPGVVGAYALAGLLHPYNSPSGLEYCVEHSIDVIGVTVSATSDDVAWLAEYDNGIVSRDRSTVFVEQDARQMQSNTIASTYNTAGSLDDPHPTPNPDGGDRRGGWYGWMAPSYYNWLLPEFLSRLDGKGVALLHCHVRDEQYSATEELNLHAAMRGVLQYCAQSWTILGVAEIVNATTVLNAGMHAALIPPVPSVWGTTDLPYPVEEVTAAGVQWMVLHHFYADTVFAAYRDAGVSVLLQGGSRHVDRARVEGLRIRGGYMLDPVYYGGGVAGGSIYGYRSTSDPWEHRTPALGQLTMQTDRLNVRGTGIRGYTEASEQGLILPAGWGNGFGRPSVLCGWECPLTNSDTYTITWDMKAITLPPEPIPDRSKFGLLFGADSDREPYDWPPDDPENNPDRMPRGRRSMYRVWQRLTGEIGIGLWADEESTMTPLATRDSPAVAKGFWNSYRLEVTPESITFTRTLIDGTAFTVTTTDTTHRGGYFWIEKEESYIGQTPSPFRAKFRNIYYTAGG